MKELSIVIPVYNEGENIVQALEKIQRAVRSDYSVLIVYDFEEDSTLLALAGCKSRFDMEIVTVRNRYGRGVLNAIKTGLETADSTYAVVTMADLSDPPEVINHMLDKAKAENADIVCGSRYMKGGMQQGGPRLKGMMSKFAGLSLHYLAGVPVHDVTNSFKLYRKSFLESCRIESRGGFELGLELVIKAWLQGRKICEVPTSWADRINGKSNFKLLKWLPHYLKWYRTALLTPAKSGTKDLPRMPFAAALSVFFIFLFCHIPGICQFGRSLDDSWGRILIFAHENNLQFGSDIIFTYGPFSYLLFPDSLSKLWSSIVFQLLLLIPLWFWFRKLVWAGAFFFVFLTLGCAPYEILMILFPLLLFCCAEEQNSKVSLTGIFCCLFAGCCGMLIKATFLPIVFLSAVLTDILLFVKRKYIAAVPFVLIFFPLLWVFPAHQNLSNLPGYLFYSWEIMHGYNDTMACQTGSAIWFLLLWGSAAVVFTIGYFHLRNAELTLLRKILYGLGLMISVLVSVKYGICRMDCQHLLKALQFLTLIAAFGAVYPYSDKFRPGRIVLCALALLLWGTAFFCYRTGGFFSQDSIWNKIIFTRSETAEKSNQTNPPCSLQTTLDVFSHDIYPFLKSGIYYKPRFVFQSYSAYTPKLAKKNAEFFQQGNAPDRIYFNENEIDERYPASLDGAVIPVLLEKYIPVNGTFFLEKRACPQKFELSLIEEKQITLGENCTVPQRKGEQVWMTVSGSYSLLGKTMKMLLHAIPLRLELMNCKEEKFSHNFMLSLAEIPVPLSPYLSSWREIPVLWNNDGEQIKTIKLTPPQNIIGIHGFDEYIGRYVWESEFTVRFFSGKIDPGGAFAVVSE